MKIAFATIYDTQDIQRGSGWPYFLSREIERQGHTVHYLGPLSICFPLGTRFFHYLSKQRMGKRYRSYQDPFTGRVLGKETDLKLQNLAYDVVLTNDYAIAAYTRTDAPLVIYTDALFPHDYRKNANPRLDKLSQFSVRFCQHVTSKGLEKAALCVFPAASTAEEALNGYGVQSQQVEIIPFGANMNDPGDRIAAGRSFARIKKKAVLELLFVGKDWQRKGGNTAVGVTKLLRQNGINAVLHVVGAEIPEEVDPNYIRSYGYLDKSSDADQQQLHQLFTDSDLFLLPSQAEGYGIAYIEAAAYGLPSLAYDTLGVATAVQNGKSGILLPRHAPPQAFADIILSWFSNPSLYEALVSGARNHYEANGRWCTSVEKLMTITERLVHFRADTSDVD